MQAQPVKQIQWIDSVIKSMNKEYFNVEDYGSILIQLGTLLKYDKCNVIKEFSDFWKKQGCEVFHSIDDSNWRVVHINFENKNNL